MMEIIHHFFNFFLISVICIAVALSFFYRYDYSFICVYV